MGQTLTNGIFLPNEGERNCYNGLEGNWRAIDGYIGNYNVHVADTVIHVSQEDRNKWDAVTGKADSSALTAHTGDTTIHVTAADKTKWDTVTSKADASALTAHTGNTTIHVTAEDKTKWDAVTSKANDADVLHKSGDETKTGKLTVTELNTTKINNLNPGALSMPNLSAIVDISSYITNLNKSANTFTPPSNGWIFIRVRKTALDHVSIRIQQQGGLISSTETADFSTWGCHLPVIASKAVEIYIYADSLASAYFCPCLGNI